MPYKQDRDFADEVADGIGSFFGILGALLALVGIHYFMKEQNKVQLPTKLESTTTPDNPIQEEIKLWGITIFAGISALVILALIDYFMVKMSAGVSFISCMGLWFLITILLGFRSLEKSQPSTDVLPEPEPPQITPSFIPRRYRITLPRDTPWNPDLSHRLIEHLLGVSYHLVLSIVAEPQHIMWEIIDWRSHVSPDEITRAVHTYYPNAVVDWDNAPARQTAYPFYRYTMFFQQAADFVWPITYVQDLKRFDPLIAMTQAMSDLQPGERATYSLVFSLPANYAHQEAEKLITISRIHPLHFLSPYGRSYAVAALAYGQTRDEKYRATDQNVARSKLAGSLFQCFLALELEAVSIERIGQLANLDSQIWQFGWEPYNALVWDSEPWPDAIRTIRNEEQDAAYNLLSQVSKWIKGSGTRWQRTRLILSPPEMASLWHLPHQSFTAPEIEWAPGRQVTAPSAATSSQDGVVLGENVHAGRKKPVVLPYPDRVMHVYIVGKTGVGKSTLMHHIIHQDIQAGKGVGVIDPHGNLVRSILRSSIPPERENDVVLLDFAQTDYPPPLNPFYVPEGVSRDAAISQILSVLKKIFEDEWSKTRMESAMYSALVALLYEDNATPRDISRLFLDAEYRTQLLQKVKDPVALEYWWDEFDRLSEGKQIQVREPVLNRIRIFYRNSAVRNMVCHPHQLDFRALIDEGKIFLANLNSDATNSEQANLGAMLMTKFQLAAMTRPPAESGHQNPFYLFVDELQQFVTTSMPTVFSEARKFGLSLTAANQYLGQLRGSTLEAILGNAGATIVFACGTDDARALSPLVKPNLTSDDLVNFDRFHAAVKMQVNGKNVPAFSLQTLPPVKAEENIAEREARIRQKSIQNYTPWSRQAVEDWLDERYRRPNVQRPTGDVTDYD